MNPITPKFKSEIISIALLAIAIAASFYFYNNFPEKVPIHWNIKGTPDNWASREAGAFLFPALITGMYFMFLFLPFLDPKKDRYAQFCKAYHIFKTIIIFAMVLIYFVASFNALGYTVAVELWTPLIIGFLFIVLGNYFGKIKPNWFIGIRTPWTLSSEEVWNKTHRTGGKIFIFGGILMLLTPFIPSKYQPVLFIAMIFMLLAGTIGLSFYYYKLEQKNTNMNKHD